MSVSKMPSQAQPFLVVCQSRAKALRSILVSLVFLVGSVWMFLTPINESDLLGHIAHVLGAYGGPPVFLLMLIIIESLMSRYPATKAKNLRFNQENMGMATGIGEASLPMTIEELLAQVGGYCEEEIRAHPNGAE